jgi:hypothetical protein
VSAGTENGIAFGQSGQLWKVPGDPSGARAYTTPRLADDVELLGPASVNLWLRSTATDTGLQATITEVRPDGQEVYVNRGWLTASHRKLDERASTATMPVQTHREADAAPLEPGTPTLVRIEVFPFEHVFRAGSRLRLVIDSPSQTGGWNFQPVSNAGVNSILHDPQHPSEIVFSTLSTRSVEEKRPACDTVLNQPCRPDAFPASGPPGELTWPRADGQEPPGEEPEGERCAGRQATIIGTAGPDELRGTRQVDVIAGRGGDDEISGLGRGDVICGGRGEDSLAGKGGADALHGGGGGDRLRGSGGADALRGNGGRDDLGGGGGKDALDGGSGRDRCRGGAGKDENRSC